MPTPAARDAASSLRASSSAWRRCSTRLVVSSETPTNAIASPARVALDDAARQQVAPAAVGAPVARLQVDRLVRRQHLLDRRGDERKIVGMDQRSHLVDRQAFGTGRHAEQLEADVAEVHAAGAQVAAPDRDLAEVDRELELGVDVAQRARRFVGLGVVHHDAEGAVGNATRAVLDLPLRVDPARLAVALDDAIALRVAAGAARRLGIDHRARDPRDECARSRRRGAAFPRPDRSPRSRRRACPSGLRPRESRAPRCRAGRIPGRCRAARPGASRGSRACVLG